MTALANHAFFIAENRRSGVVAGWAKFWYVGKLSKKIFHVQFLCLKMQYLRLKTPILKKKLAATLKF